MAARYFESSRMGLRTLILPAALAAVVTALAVPSRATTITFNPGNGAIAGIQSFAYAPGNVDAQGAITNGQTGPQPGNTYNVYYQSILSSANDVNSNPLASASGGTGNFNNSGTEFTVIAGFRETITSGSDAPGGTLNFSVVSPNNFSLSTATPNFFEIFAATPGSSNSTAGTGFWQNSTPILSGFVVTPPAGAFGTGNFGNIPAGTVPLNGTSNPSPLGNPQTIQGNGSTQLLVQVVTANPAFFPVNPQFLSFSTSNFLPATHVTPTNSFSNGNGNGNVTATVGATNGINGPDVVFESDSSNGFGPVVVPEPSSIIPAVTAATLIPMFLGFMRRRANKTVA
jgi:hypothetical protein